MWDHGVLHETSLSYVAGTISGLAGGAAMLLAFMGLGAVTATDPFWIPKRIAALFLGRTNVGRAWTWFGVVVHFLFSAAFGALYALVVTKLTHEIWMTGVAYALLLWVINFWGGHLSAAGRQMLAKKPAWLSPIVHVAYGGFMALVAEGFASGALR